MKGNKIIVTASIIGMLSFVLLTIVTTFAFFNYTKKGVTENSVTTGTLTFIYTEVEANGGSKWRK